MKMFLIIMALSASNLLASLDGEVGGLNLAVSESDPRKINQALVALQLAINQIEPFDSPVDAPSETRVKARQDIQQAIEPIKDELVELTRNPDSTVAQTATTVLGSASPSKEVYNALKHNLQNTKSQGVAASSLIALSKAGLMDDEVGTIAADRIGEYQSGSNPDLALNLIRTAAYVPVPQATKQLIEIIKSDDRVGAKMIAANAIMKLGPAGAEALPDLEKLLQELEQQGGDFRDVNTIKRAIMLVCGRSDTPQAVTPPAEMAQTTPIPSRATPNHLPKSGTSPLPVVQAEPSKSSPWPWIIGAILVLAIAGGILLKLRRK